MNRWIAHAIKISIIWIDRSYKPHRYVANLSLNYYFILIKRFMRVRLIWQQRTIFCGCISHSLVLSSPALTLSVAPQSCCRRSWPRPQWRGGWATAERSCPPPVFGCRSERDVRKWTVRTTLSLWPGLILWARRQLGVPANSRRHLWLADARKVHWRQATAIGCLWLVLLGQSSRKTGWEK